MSVKQEIKDFFKECVQDSFKEALKDEVMKVLSGEKDSLKLALIPPNLIFSVIEEINGCELEDNMDTNGWQVDYWKNFTYKDKKYCISGSMYYGKVSIYESEDE